MRVLVFTPNSSRELPPLLLKSLVWLILSIGAGVSSFAQQTDDVIVLEHADKLVGRILEGENIRELIGNVRFRQGTLSVTCDHAVQYLESDKISLSGNVVVRDDTLTMRGERGIYYRDMRMAEAFEGVRLDDGHTTVKSDYGRYYAAEQRAFFEGNVFVADTASTLSADELTYYREENRSVAKGNVRIVNFADRTTVEGHYFEHDRERRFSRMLEQPRVLLIDSTADGTLDTFVITSLVMESYQDTVRRFVAIDSVEMWGPDLAAAGGLAHYYMELDSMILRRNPVIWYEQNQVSGDSIFVKLVERKPHRLYVRGDAFAISESDSLHPKRLNQVSGESMTLYFQNDKLERIEVDDRATSLYFLYDEGGEETVRIPNGLNKTTGDRVVIEFSEGVVNSISVVGGVQGEYVPENLVAGKESEFYLSGFYPRQRPTGLAPALQSGRRL